MRRLIALLLILLWTPLAHGDGWFFAGGAVVCDDCSGSTGFAWHMESTDITSGTPCGCTDTTANKTMTLTSASLSGTQKSDGSQSLYCNGANQYASITSTSTDFSTSDGTVTFDIYVSTYASGGRPWSEYRFSNHQLGIYMANYTSGSTLDWTFTYLKDTNTWSVTADSNKSLSQWLRITAKWKVGANPDMSLSVCDLNTSTGATSNCVTNTAHNTISAPSQPNVRYVGNYSANASVFYIDNLKETSGDSGL